MKNCIILGCGRSGTSLLGGIMHQAGYFMGERLHPGLPSNPKGFFEWMEINRINEEILEPYRTPSLGGFLRRTLQGKGTVLDPIGRNQRWLLALPTHAAVECSDEGVIARIRTVCSRQPFCYKDPRFSYTLPVWRPQLPADTVFLCVFREPDLTVNSMLKECAERDYLKSLHITPASAYRVWHTLYSRILQYRHRDAVPVHFISYPHILDGSALPRLQEILGLDLKPGFADPALCRSRSAGSIPLSCQNIYRELYRLSQEN